MLSHRTLQPTDIVVYAVLNLIWSPLWPNLKKRSGVQSHISSYMQRDCTISFLNLRLKVSGV